MNLTPRSLLTKIIASTGVLAVAMLGLVMLMLAEQFRTSAHVLHDRGLYQMSEQISRHLYWAEDGSLQADLPSDLVGMMEPNGEHSFTVNDLDGNVLLAKPRDQDLSLHPFRPHSESEIEYFQHVSEPNESYYGATVQWTIDRLPVWIQVTKEVYHDELLTGIVAIFLSSATWVIVPFFLLLVLINVLVVRRAMMPLQQASGRAMEISPASPRVRLPTEGIPVEVLPLIRAVNTAVDRLDGALAAQRQFTADAAHELLTPLAVLTANIDTLKDRSTALTLRQDVDSMTDLVTQLLELAEAESAGSSQSKLVDLHRVCLEITEMLAPLAYRQGKSLAVTGRDAPVLTRGLVNPLSRALRNLIENAIEHTPEGTLVDIHLREDATISVSDKGPGVPQDMRDVVFQRFWRGDRRTGPGAGLGLSIVKRIVEAHGGSVSVDDAPGGGARFTIRLELADAGDEPAEPPVEIGRLV